MHVQHMENRFLHRLASARVPHVGKVVIGLEHDTGELLSHSEGETRPTLRRQGFLVAIASEEDQELAVAPHS